MVSGIRDYIAEKVSSAVECGVESEGLEKGECTDREENKKMREGVKNGVGRIQWKGRSGGGGRRVKMEGGLNKSNIRGHGRIA